MHKNKASEQIGRSMVEMLGVLAVVAVLTVSAIAGYSKVLYKFRTDRAMEDLSALAADIGAKFSHIGTYTGLTSKVAYNVGLFGPDMTKTCNSESDVANISTSSSEETSGNEKVVVSTVNSIGTTCVISILNGSSIAVSANSDGKSFVIAVDKIFRNSCATFASQDWGNGSGFNSLTITPESGAPVKILRNMSASEMIQAGINCGNCVEGKCIAVWTFN